MKSYKLIAIFLVALMSVACGKKDENKRNFVSVSGLGDANGGGGIKREGKILTFGEFGVTVKRKDIKEVQGLKELEQGLDILTLPENIKGKILMAMTPLGKRKYYDINANEISPSQQQFIIQKYQAAIRENIPAKHLKILALTIGNETFILPDFYKLKDNIARAAILFHESIWVINPKLDYKVVIASEIAFEKFLRTNLNVNKIAYDSDLLQALKLTFNDPYIGITSAANYEFYQQKTQEYTSVDGERVIVKDAHFPMEFMLGHLAIDNLMTNPSLNKNLVYEHLFRLYKLNPNSMIIRELLIESLGMGSSLVLKVHSYHKSGKVHLDHIISAKENEFYDGSIGWWVKILAFWQGRLGDETFNLKLPFFIDKSGSPVGFKGEKGSIGLENRPNDGQILYQKNESISLHVKGVQVELPTVILQDNEKCELVIFSWRLIEGESYRRRSVETRPVETREEGETYNRQSTDEYEEYHHYTRCYQDWD